MAKKLGTYRHGMSHTKLYYVWQAMRSRCYNPKDKNYHHYGGRGINYDIRWDDFVVFLKDMGGTYKHGLELDRRDNDRGYSKENCRWTDKITQRNNRRTTRKIDVLGVLIPVSTIARECGINRGTFIYRLNKGEDVITALRPVK